MANGAIVPRVELTFDAICKNPAMRIIAIIMVITMKTQTEQIEILTEALRSILIQDTGDLSDAAFRRYVCQIIATKTLAKVEGGAE